MRIWLWIWLLRHIRFKEKYENLYVCITRIWISVVCLPSWDGSFTIVNQFCSNNKIFITYRWFSIFYFLRKWKLKSIDHKSENFHEKYYICDSYLFEFAKIVLLPYPRDWRNLILLQLIVNNSKATKTESKKFGPVPRALPSISLPQKLYESPALLLQKKLSWGKNTPSIISDEWAAIFTNRSSKKTWQFSLLFLSFFFFFYPTKDRCKLN